MAGIGTLSDFVIELQPELEPREIDIFQEKYKPRSIDELYQNELNATRFGNWNRNRKLKLQGVTTETVSKIQSFVIIHGPIGCGKSTFAELVLKDYDVSEFSDSVERKSLFKAAKHILNSHSVSNEMSEIKKKLLF